MIKFKIKVIIGLLESDRFFLSNSDIKRTSIPNAGVNRLCIKEMRRGGQNIWIL